MSNNKQPISKSALIVVDVQDSFKYGNPERWTQRGPNPEQFENNINRLLAGFRQAALPIYFILHSDEDPGFGTDSPYYRLMDFMDRLPEDPIIEKETRNAFTSTHLQRALTQQGVHRLVITGISTEQCCETTTRVAADLGFDVDFVTEATLTFPIPNPETGEFLAVDDIVERTEYALRRRFAQIATVDQIMAEVEELG